MALVVLPMGLHRLGLDGPPTYDPIAAAPVLAAEDFDQLTKDLRSLTVGVDPIDAQVQVAMTTLRRSGAAVISTGQRFQDVRKLDTNASLLLEQEARTCLARLVAANDISIERVDVVADPGGQWAEVTIDYVNKRLAKPRTKQISVFIRPEATGQ